MPINHDTTSMRDLMCASINEGHIGQRLSVDETSMEAVI